MFELGIGELQQLTYLFLQTEGGTGPKEILDDDIYRKRYSKINLRKLVLILEKYRNDKYALSQGQTSGSEQLDKIIAKMQ